MHVAVFRYNKSFARLYSKLLFLFRSCSALLQNFGVRFDIYMKRGNLSEGGHGKITWKHFRDLLTRRRDNVTLKRGGDVPQRCYWMFHLGLTEEVVDTYHLNFLETYQRDVVGCFIWDLLEASHWDVLTTFHWDVVGCFIWDIQRDVVTTSPRCLVTGWDLYEKLPFEKRMLLNNSLLLQSKN